MTADDRFNQFEPVIAEVITILDRHTNQPKQLTIATGQIIMAISQQGDSISFLLREQVMMKGDIAEIKGDVAGIKDDAAGIEGDVVGIKAGQAGLESKIVGLDSKIDQVLQFLQKPGQ